MFRGDPIVVPPNLRQLSADERDAYVKNARRYHAYWYIMYDRPQSHVDLSRQRQSVSPTSERYRDLMCQLSREELACLTPFAKGLEVLDTHRDNEHNDGPYQRRTLGVVTDAFQHPSTGSVWVCLRLYNSPEGHIACMQIEQGGLRGLSLQHVRQGDAVQMREVSICFLGKRTGTNLQCTVYKKDCPDLTQNSVPYLHPPFIIHKASSTTKDDVVIRPSPFIPVPTSKLMVVSVLSQFFFSI